MTSQRLGYLLGSTRRDRGDIPQTPGKRAATIRSTPAAWRPIILAAGLIVLAALAAYHNSFAGPFVYDDIRSISQNQSIRRLWPIWPALSPPTDGQTVSGRPLLNLSLALNYALGGLDVRGYHATNLAIHIAAALLLFGILRRTFLTPKLRDRLGRAAAALALAGTLPWTLHPLQTESVTYIIQRAESLAGLFYLLTLYCVIRGATGTVPLGRAGPAPWPWYAGAVLACLLGIATKEIMATAPLMVFLYDRTFLAGSFGRAWRRRWGLYLSVAATWGLLAYLIVSTGLIARQSESGAPDAWSYACTQPGVILHYLRLSVWPHPLCLQYAWPVAHSLREILPGAIVVGLILAATVCGLTGRKCWGFLGAWFLLTLAPTSSLIPLGQLAFEHRMYLSLGAVAVAVVAGGYALWKEVVPQRARSGHRATAVRWVAPAAVLATVLLALGNATIARNSDYRTSLAIWQATVGTSPNSPDAHANLGVALADLGRNGEAIQHYHQALRLGPGSPLVHTNLGNALAALGRTEEAIQQHQEALRLKPGYAEAHTNLGATLAGLGKTEEAIEHYTEALRLKPDFAEAHHNLGIALSKIGKLQPALEHWEQALRLKPDYAGARTNLGLALATLGRTEEAIRQHQEALRLNPGYAEAHANLGAMLARLGKTEEAIEHYTEALRLKPDFAEAHNNLGNALTRLGRTDEAIEHYRQALLGKPDYADAHNNLGIALARLGKADEAIEHYRAALQLKPDYAPIYNNLGAALTQAGKTAEAIQQYGEALRLKPDYAEAQTNLAWLLATQEPGAGGDPIRAVQLAERACQLSRQQNVQHLDVLAAAYAAAGRFPEAVSIAEKGVRLAELTGQAALARDIQSRLELYRAGRPYRQMPHSLGQGKP